MPRVLGSRGDGTAWWTTRAWRTPGWTGGSDPLDDSRVLWNAQALGLDGWSRRGHGAGLGGGAGCCCGGPQGRLERRPGDARREADHDDVGRGVPPAELCAHLIGCAGDGELAEDRLRLGGDLPAAWGGMRVGGTDRLDLGAVALLGEGAGVAVAPGAQVPGD